MFNFDFVFGYLTPLIRNICVEVILTFYLGISNFRILGLFGNAPHLFPKLQNHLFLIITRYELITFPSKANFPFIYLFISWASESCPPLTNEVSLNLLDERVLYLRSLRCVLNHIFYIEASAVY